MIIIVMIFILIVIMMIRRECEDKRNAQGEDIDLAKKRVRG
jgi:hypothetical protein